ncbi:MAG: hypothetical protein V7782_05010, partial [Psychromonas sp.]
VGLLVVMEIKQHWVIGILMIINIQMAENQSLNISMISVWSLGFGLSLRWSIKNLFYTENILIGC